MDEFTKRHFGFTVVTINDIEKMVKHCKALALDEEEN